MTVRYGVVRVPDLTSVEAAAVRAYDSAGEHTASTVPASKLPAALDFHLHQLKHLGADDGWMAVTYMVLRQLTLVLLHLLLAVHLLVVDSVAVLEAAASEAEVVLAVDPAEVASAVAAAEALVEDVAN